MSKSTVRLFAVRYGTSLMPNVSKNIPLFPPTDQQILSSELFPPARIPEDPSSIGFHRPSVSLVLGSIDDKYMLYKWQEKQIAQMGLAGFRRHMKDRLEIGIKMHAGIKKILDLKANDRLPKRDQILAKIGVPEKSPYSGYIRSVLPLVDVLRPVDIIAQEKTVRHPLLAYQGRFDAVLEYNGEVCVVDWKTSPPGTNFNKFGEESLSYPTYSRQLAAYASAFNSDINCSQYPMVKRGLLVSAKEDGSDAEVFELSSDNLQAYFLEYREQIEFFWTRSVAALTNNSYVDFAYSPPAAQE